MGFGTFYGNTDFNCLMLNVLENGFFSQHKLVVKSLNIKCFNVFPGKADCISPFLSKGTFSIRKNLIWFSESAIWQQAFRVLWLALMDARDSEVVDTFYRSIFMYYLHRGVVFAFKKNITILYGWTQLQLILGIHIFILLTVLLR